jgi:hypothetical protein
MLTLIAASEISANLWHNGILIGAIGLWFSVIVDLQIILFMYMADSCCVAKAISVRPVIEFTSAVKGGGEGQGNSRGTAQVG